MHASSRVNKTIYKKPQFTGSLKTAQMCRALFFCVILWLFTAQADPLKGNVWAVYDLLERVVPDSTDHFSFSLSDDACQGTGTKACFTISDEGSKTRIEATTASELTMGLGVYFREFCNMTIGWPRGGGSHVFKPAEWPKVGSTVVRARNVPWSYMMNVSTNCFVPPSTSPSRFT